MRDSREFSPITNKRLSATITQYQDRVRYMKADALQIIDLCAAICTDDAVKLSDKQIKNINAIVSAATRIRDTAGR